MPSGYWPRKLFFGLLGLSLALFAWLAARPVESRQVPAGTGDTYFLDVSGTAGITATHYTDILIIGQAWGDVNQRGWWFIPAIGGR